MNVTKLKKYGISLVSALCFLVIMALPGGAEVPNKLNYQGYLTNSSGNPINGTISMAFSIYDVATGGTAAWSETQSVVVDDGVYSVRLGEVTPIDLTEATTFYLGVTVGSDPEMTPRAELTSVPYALFVEGVTIASNTLVGRGAGVNNTTGYENTFIGNDAGSANTTGFSNTFLGRDAGSANTAGFSNTFLGEDAGSANTTGYRNTFIGDNAGY